jgi:hypothetical protein
MAVKATIPATILFICCLPLISLLHNAGCYLLQRRGRRLVDRIMNFFLLSGDHIRIDYRFSDNSRRWQDMRLAILENFQALHFSLDTKSDKQINSYLYYYAN